MAQDGNGTLVDSPSAASGGAAEPAASRHRRSKRKHDTDTSSSSSSSSDESSRSRKRKYKSSRSSSRRHRRSSSTDSSSDSDSDRDRRRRRREKERRKEKDERRRKREKERKKKKKEKEKEKEKGVKGAVTNSWGKYGIIRETDMWNKRPEFTAWLSEVKKMNLETLPNWEEKQMFKDFMEDHNTATFPSKKYYGLDAYHHRQLEKEIKRGSKKSKETERIVFNDEEQRRQELLKIREKQKEEQVEALKCSMQSGMAQAMKEQSRLREEMAYQYKLGNFEAAAAIQRRLDPDAAP